MPRLIHLLATLSIFVLPLPGVESQDESRSASNSRSTSDGGTTLPTVSPTEIDPATFCSMVFDNVGPFCQFVAPNNGPCLDEFSDTTCDSCTNILNSCGTFNGDICLSSLASSCPQSEEFLMDYCLVVDNTCMGPGVVNDFREPEEPSGDGLSGNNGPGVSGSGSTSGDGGAGPEAGGLSGSGESGGPPFQGSGNSSNGGDGDTGPAPSTPPSLLPLVSRASLTEQQRENIVTIGFTGISEQQFIERGVPVFREEVANTVNMFFNSNQLTKRQQPLFTPEDIFVIDSLTLVVINGDFVLLIEFVVGGQDQSLLVSGGDVANLLQVEGPRLAMALSNVIGSPVEFFGVIGLELPTTPPSELPTTPPSDISAPNEALQSLLSGNYVIGVAVGVCVASVLVVITMVAIAIASCIIKKKRRESAAATYVEVPAGDENSFDTNWQPMTVNVGDDYIAVPTTFRRNSEQESDNSTAI